MELRKVFERISRNGLKIKLVEERNLKGVKLAEIFNSSQEKIKEK